MLQGYPSKQSEIIAQPATLVLKDRVGKSNNVALLTLNRPEAFNALSEQLLKEVLSFISFAFSSQIYLYLYVPYA